MDTLCSNSDLLVLLFNIADTNQPADSLLAGYFARVVGSLLMRRGKELLAWLEVGHKNNNTISKIVPTIGIASEATVYGTQ